MARGLIDVTDAGGARGLASSVLDRGRSLPIVCLTSRPGERGPALDADQVLELVGAHVPVYFALTGPATRELRRCLPPALDVFGGAARIWWPGVTAQSAVRDHPLVVDRHQVYGSLAMKRLTKAFRRGPPAHPAGEVDPARALLRAERDDARTERDRLRERIAHLKRDLSQASAELSRTRRAERDARRELRERVAAEQSQPGSTPDLDAEFRMLIVDQWTRALQAAERNRRPLRPLILGGEFLPSVRRLDGVSLERIAWTAAMVSCKLAPQLDGLELHRLRSGLGQTDPPRVRARDSATAWRCALKRNTPNAPRLHFWEVPGGLVELGAAVGHDDFAIPE